MGASEKPWPQTAQRLGLHLTRRYGLVRGPSYRAKVFFAHLAKINILLSITIFGSEVMLWYRLVD